VLAAGLNLRAGPGVVYDSIGVVTEGEQFDVTGINSSSEWYQIATDDEVVGWISSDPPLVAITPEDAEPPTILVPRLSPSSSASSSTSTTSSTTTSPAPATTSSPSTTSTTTAPSDSGTDTFILQTASGGEFYLVRPATGEVQLITSGIDPAFSPDMSQIAFTRWTSGGAAGVMLYDLASGTERQIIGETKQAKSPTWSPDGSKLMVSFQNGGRPEIESVCKERGGRIPREAYDIQIGSDTGRICYKLPADPYWQLREIVVATGEYQDMASATYSYAPTWDPINDWRVVFAGEDGLQQLDVNRNEYFAFTENLRDRGPVFSPDGQWVAVTYRESNAWHIQIISTTDGTRQALTTTDALADEVINNAAPAWSPDSSQLAFVTDRNGEWEFYVMNIDGSNQQPLLSPEIAEQIPVQYNGVDERLINWR
jgi:Tol biopolymer transport system component